MRYLIQQRILQLFVTTVLRPRLTWRPSKKIYDTFCALAGVLLFRYVRADMFQNFSELIEAASQGNQRSVDQFSDDLLTTAGAAEGDDSFYAKFTEEVQELPALVFCFGKAVGSEIGISIVKTRLPSNLRQDHPRMRAFC